MKNSVLKVENLSIAFGGNQVFDNICLDFKEREIHGIIGTNGSGKTTLFNCICGIYRPAAGKVILRERDITGIATWKIARLGIGRCFQSVMMFNSLTPRENILVARSKAGNYNKQQENFSVDQIIEMCNLTEKADVRTAELPLPDKKNTEIARALACNPDIMLFDEVSCGLSGKEIYSRMELMKTIAEYGITIIVIEHIMMFIKEICDVVSVLHAGSILAQGKPDMVAQNPDVIDAYIGGGHNVKSRSES